MRLYNMTTDPGFDHSGLLAGPDYRLSGTSLGSEYFGWSTVKINIFSSATEFEKTYTPYSPLCQYEHLCTNVTLEYFTYGTLPSYSLKRLQKWVKYLEDRNIKHSALHEEKKFKLTIDDPRYLIYVSPACYANGVEFIIRNRDFNEIPRQIEYEWGK